MEEVNHCGSEQMPRHRLRFTLGQLLVFMLVLSVMLGLVTQLKHVGAVAACCLAGMLLGRVLGRPALIQASVTALLVFTITYLACWVSLGDRGVMEFRRPLLARTELEWLSDTLTKHLEAGGSLPDRLEDAPGVSSGPSRLDPSGQPLDPWGHPYQYRKTVDRFELASLGRDGRTGGVGLDADVTLDGSRPPQTRLPISQFVFETEGSRSVFLVALVASVLSGSLWFRTARHDSLPFRAAVAGIAAATLFTVLVASFLAAFHVAASQSGH